MCKVFVPSLGFIGDIARNLVLNICHGHYINSTVDKIFFHDIISWYIALVWNFNSVINISFNCKYPAGNCMFGVDNGDAGAACGVCSRVWTWLAPCSGVTVVDFGQLNACWVLVMLMARFLLTNDIFDWFIYFVIIFCSIRLFIIFYCKYY